MLKIFSFVKIITDKMSFSFKLQRLTTEVSAKMYVAVWLLC